MLTDHLGSSFTRVDTMFEYDMKKVSINKVTIFNIDLLSSTHTLSELSQIF